MWGCIFFMWGCISKASEHCRRKPLHSSTTPEKGACRAMALAIIGREVAMVDAEVVGSVGGGAGMRTCQRLSMSSWKGSNWLMLNHSVFQVRSSVMEADWTQRIIIQCNVD